MSLSWFSMSCSTLPVTMFALGWAELSGVQPIRPPPPSPIDSGLPWDSPSMQEAMPAAAACEYPCCTRYRAMAVRLLPDAMACWICAPRLPEPPDDDWAGEAEAVSAPVGAELLAASACRGWDVAVANEAGGS